MCPGETFFDHWSHSDGLNTILEAPLSHIDLSSASSTIFQVNPAGSADPVGFHAPLVQGQNLQK